MSSAKHTRRSLRESLTRGNVFVRVATGIITIPLGLIIWHLMNLDDGVWWLFSALALLGVLRFILWFLLPVADASNLMTTKVNQNQSEP
jgi:hypothetical protein